MSLSHFDDVGNAQMVDVSAKPVTARTAVAEGQVRMTPATLALITEAHRVDDFFTLTHRLERMSIAVTQRVQQLVQKRETGIEGCAHRTWRCKLAKIFKVQPHTPYAAMPPAQVV